MFVEHNISFPKLDDVDFYLTGGAVRDLVMGEKPKDLDFLMVTELSFEDILEKLKKEPNVKVYQVKEEFQIILLGVKNGKKYVGVDLAFPRIDGCYSDGRRPDTTTRTNNLKLDASRRDFTINSLYMKEDGQIIDFFNGLDDIRAKKIKAVGSPTKRFNEDALRMIRAARFATQLKFTIDEPTYQAMFRNMYLINKKMISMDRIRVEVNKMLKNDPHMAMIYLLDLGIIDFLKQRKEPFMFEMRQKE